MQHQQDIVAERAVLGIDQVKPGFARHTAAGVDLFGLLRGAALGQKPLFGFMIGQRGEPGNTGAAFQHLGVELGKHPDVARIWRARPDERDIAPDHVPQLRQLIEPGAAQKPAERGDPPSLVAAGNAMIALAAHVDHGAELPQGEGFAGRPCALVAEKDRATIADEDDNGNQGNHRQEHHAKCQRQRQIKQALGDRHPCYPSGNASRPHRGPV